MCLESSGGRNVFGHDVTKVAASQLPYTKGSEVTEAKYLAYKAKRSEHGSQGVGPTQLTWWEFQDRADNEGGCWRTDINMRVGFSILADYIKRHGFEGAFTRYNTGKAGESPYGTKAMNLLPKWQKIVEGK